MTRQIEAMDRPWRLGISGAGITVGLVSRLLASNGVTELTSTPVSVFAAIACALTGLGLALTAAQRDSFGRTLWWLVGSTALAYSALMWISPPFADGTDVWDNTQQGVLALVGLGVGVLIAGIVTLALVRRVPTLSVALFLICGVVVLAANTLFLFSEWTGIVLMFAAFVLMLFAWDRSPRREEQFDPPALAPRTSRAGLSLAVVALLGTALQLWVSRDDTPRALPAIVVSCALLITTFWVIYRLRREFQRREMPLSEWTSWMREIRTNDFQDELEAFAPVDEPAMSTTHTDPVFGGSALEDHDGVEKALEAPPIIPVSPSESPAIESDVGEPTEIPRVLPRVAEPSPTEAQAANANGDRRVDASPAGAFSAQVTTAESVEADNRPAPARSTGRISDLAEWMASDPVSPTDRPLYVAIEAMRLDHYDALDAAHKGQLRSGAADVLASAPTDADLLVWIDGPYFILAYASVPNDELSSLNRNLAPLLHSPIADHTYLNGTLAMLRPGPTITTDELLDQAVVALLRAREVQTAAASA